MRISALLVQWADGWLERTVTATYRREAVLGLGAVQSELEAARQADDQLAVFAVVTEETSLTHDDDGETTTLAYQVGDAIVVPDSGLGPVQLRVVAKKISEDDEGVVTVAPTLGELVLDPTERIGRAVKKMSNGAVMGHSKVATPLSANDIAGSSCCQPDGPPPPT